MPKTQYRLAPGSLVNPPHSWPLALPRMAHHCACLAAWFLS